MTGVVELGKRRSLRIGCLRVEPARCEVEGPAGRRRLEPRIMQVLVALHDARGDTVTRDRLIETCWDGRIVGEDAINRAILRIRKIASELANGSFTIVTVPKIGYRLCADENVGKTSKPSDVAPIAIAVLPFQTVGGDESYFAEGVAEDIRTALSREPSLRVAGRTSSWLVRDMESKDIAERLTVSYVIEGSVRQAAERVRVTVALVDGRTGLSIWSESYDGRLDDVFAIQAEIAGCVAANLNRALPDASVPNRMGPSDGQAYNLYLAGRALLRERASGRTAAAAELLRRACEIDPDFTPARSRLSIALAMQAMFELHPAEGSRRRSEALAQAKLARARAPQSPEAEASYGAVLYQDDIHSALAHLEQARLLGEDNSEFWFWLSAARERIGDYSGCIIAARRVVELDPLWYGTIFAALMAIDFGLEEEAKRWLAPIAQHRHHAFSGSLLDANLALFRNDYAAALENARQSASHGDPDLIAFALATAARALLNLGRPGEARTTAPFIVTEAEVELREGRIPHGVLDRPFGGDRRNLRVNAERYFAFRLLVREGRSDEVVHYYEETLGVPAALEQHPDGPEAALFDAAIIGRAMQDCRQFCESDELLARGDAMLQSLLRSEFFPRSLLLASAQIAAVRGRRERAVSELERVSAVGLSPFHPAAWSDVFSDPCFDLLRALPQFRDFERRASDAWRRGNHKRSGSSRQGE